MHTHLLLPYPARQLGVESRAIRYNVGHFNRWVIEHVHKLQEGDLVSFPVPLDLHPSSRQRAFHRILEQAGWHLVEKKTSKDGKLLWILKPPEAYFRQRKQRQQRILLGLVAGGILTVAIIMLLLHA